MIEKGSFRLQGWWLEDPRIYLAEPSVGSIYYIASAKGKKWTSLRRAQLLIGTLTCCFSKMKRNADRGLLSNKADTSVVVVFSPRGAAAWPRETVYPSFCDRAMEHGQNQSRPYTNDRSTLPIQNQVFSIDVLDYRTASHKKICVFIARSVLVAGTALDPNCLQLCPKRPASVLLRQHNACYRCLNETTQIHMCRHIRKIARHKGRQADRKIDRPIDSDKQIGTSVDRSIDRKLEGKMGRCVDGQTDRSVVRERQMGGLRLRDRRDQIEQIEKMEQIKEREANSTDKVDRVNAADGCCKQDKISFDLGRFGQTRGLATQGYRQKEIQTGRGIDRQRYKPDRNRHI